MGVNLGPCTLEWPLADTRRERYNRGVKKTALRFAKDFKRTIDPYEADPYYAQACENAKEAFRKLREMGIVDAEGRRIRTGLPADMEEGKDRDFGG